MKHTLMSLRHNLTNLKPIDLACINFIVFLLFNKINNYYFLNTISTKVH